MKIPSLKWSDRKIRKLSNPFLSPLNTTSINFDRFAYQNNSSSHKKPNKRSTYNVYGEDN